jgi:hypothetical protein
MYKGKKHDNITYTAVDVGIIVVLVVLLVFIVIILLTLSKTLSKKTTDMIGFVYKLPISKKVVLEISYVNLQPCRATDTT